MKKRVAVIGKKGRLGAALCRDLTNEYDVFALGRENVDLERPVPDQLQGVEFDLLINTAAATNVDWCENNRARAHRINATSVGELGLLTAKLGIRMIHISTDYVFDGKSRRPYHETDPAHPISAYGRTKKEGEDILLETSPDHLAIRVSWVFGPDKPSFVDSIIDRAINHSTAEAIADKFSAPTYTLDFAAWLRPLLFEQPIGGLLHLCNGGECTWQEYGQWAVDVAGKQGLELSAKEIKPINLTSMKTFVAERPIYTVMDTSRFTTVTGIRPRPWREAVSDFVREKFRRQA
jgi:dTDP-4-dehydrorhamnose reductase